MTAMTPVLNIDFQLLLNSWTVELKYLVENNAIE